MIVLAVFASCAMKMLIDAGGKALTKSTPQILKRRDETAVREVVVEINSSTGVRTVELRRCYTNELVYVYKTSMPHSRLSSSLSPRWSSVTLVMASASTIHEEVRMG